MEKVRSYVRSLPPGFKFCPSDEELVGFFLTKKLKNEPLPPSEIQEVDVYNQNPKDLTAKYREWGSKGAWYFFTLRNGLNRNGKRPSRSAGDGYWRATSGNNAVKNKAGNNVGNKRVLRFHKGKPSNDEKTNWIMHEYTLNESPQTQSNRNPNDHMKLDGWVLCRIYERIDNKSCSRRQKDHSKGERVFPRQEKENEHMDMDDDIMAKLDDEEDCLEEEHCLEEEILALLNGEESNNNDISSVPVPDPDPEEQSLKDMTAMLDDDLSCVPFLDPKEHFLEEDIMAILDDDESNNSNKGDKP